MNKSAFTSNDISQMRTALTIAQRGLGEVYPNPTVGCVLVREDLNNLIVGRGWTQVGGRPHAEAEAIRKAGTMAHDSTAYVTLEPCSHYGETSPCTDALIKAGIKKVFLSVKDPDRRVSGTGIKRLKEAGIEVYVGLLKQEALQINKGFFSLVTKKRPMITWKIASSADGKIATKNGDSKWVTNDLSRKQGHLLRAEHDIILTSINTALEDDPELTCRLPGLMHRSPQPIVLDSQLRLPPTSKLMNGMLKPWIYTNCQAPRERQLKLEELGAKIFKIKRGASKELSLNQIILHLSDIGITRVLLECGGTLAKSFLQKGLIDQIYWYRSPIIIGSDGLAAVNTLNISTIKNSLLFSHRNTYNFGSDTLSIFDKKEIIGRKCSQA